MHIQKGAMVRLRLGIEDQANWYVSHLSSMCSNMDLSRGGVRGSAVPLLAHTLQDHKVQQSCDKAKEAGARKHLTCLF